MNASNKKAFFILGPESSGTKILTDLFIRAGCAGSSEHHQPFDYVRPPVDEELIVWRRSYRFSGVWPRLGELLEKCEDYHPIAIVILRDMGCTVKSQLKNRHVKTEAQAWEQIQKAHTMIFNQTKNMERWVISYEALVYDTESVLGWLGKVTGLTFPPVTDLFNGNEKYNA